METLLPGVVRRVLKGAALQPRWVPRRVLTVVSADVDTAGGVGAVWVVWRPKSPRAREHTALLEWYDEQWSYVGGGIGSPSDPAGVDVIEVRGGGGALSLTRRLDPPHSIATAPWIGCVEVHLGQDVSHVLIGNRRVDAPQQRKLIAAWKSSHADRARPVIVALAPDGTELSRIGPHDVLDTHTWARLREEL
ncbi:hypothetical protein [Streptomyces sp. NRRL F-5123]|uniref:hypothetical protein n=1 Tax=Streptomyces sp. NRRL F-5123 TaxID=1463856 RepID=UPI001F1B9085|nr:hypothetical protein [Streptomyces sp. NRRL F-5123]